MQRDDLRQKAWVINELGDKVLDALSQAVDATREDFRQYESQHPDWVAQSSPSGLANWIHDRMFHNARHLLQEVDDVVFHTKGSIREIIINDRFRLRLKRHRKPASVATYPTQGALDFMNQPLVDEILADMEQVHLIAGYIWDDDARVIGFPILSMRDGLENVLWVHELSYETELPLEFASQDIPSPSVVRSRVRNRMHETKVVDDR